MADMTLNEVGGWCLGWKHSPMVGWTTEGGSYVHVGDHCPGITLDDPPTDAQYGSAARLIDLAVETDLDAFTEYFEKRRGNLSNYYGFHSDALSDKVWAAIQTRIHLTPEHVQQAWKEMH